jgi:hypothetical protein
MFINAQRRILKKFMMVMQGQPFKIVVSNGMTNFHYYSAVY